MSKRKPAARKLTLKQLADVHLAMQFLTADFESMSGDCDKQRSRRIENAINVLHKLIQAATPKERKQ